MRFLKRSQLSPYNVKDSGVAIDHNRQIIMESTNSLLIPSGPNGSRPATPIEGHIRYNESSQELEARQGGAWRQFRYKESGGITQQTLGVGDYIETTFGPLNPAPPTTVASGTTWTGANLIVVVENVIQLFNSNYTIVQNPANVLASVISFNSTSKFIISGSTAVVNFVDKGYRVDQKIIVTGSANNNATFTVTNVTEDILTVAETVNDESQGAAVSIIGLASDDLTPYTLGYYCVFGEAVPISKAVTVLHGFDQ